MILLNCGQTGSGKTLYACWQIENDKKLNQKKVYFPSTMRDITPNAKEKGWVEIKRFDAQNTSVEFVNDNSIIFIEHGEEIFPKSATKAMCEKYVDFLYDCKNKNIDVYITVGLPPNPEPSDLPHSLHRCITKFVKEYRYFVPIEHGKKSFIYQTRAPFKTEWCFVFPRSNLNAG